MVIIRTIAIIGAAIFAIATVFTVLVALGFPLGEFIMGGRHKIVPSEIRILCCVSAIVQILAIVIVLQTGNVIPVWFPFKITRGICFFFAIYLSANAIMNFLSSSVKERLLMTPLSLLAAICFWLVAFSSLMCVNEK